MPAIGGCIDLGRGMAISLKAWSWGLVNLIDFASLHIIAEGVTQNSRKGA